MPAKVRRVTAVLAATLSGLMAGCHDNHVGSDHYDDGGVRGKVCVIDNDQVILDLPEVRVSWGTLYVYGRVHRRPGVKGEIQGRVDIELLSSDGEYLDGLPALIVPRAVPVDPTMSASYSTSYGFVPPPGSIVRVHFIDHETQIKEDEDISPGVFQYHDNSQPKTDGTPGSDATTQKSTTSHW